MLYKEYQGRLFAVLLSLITCTVAFSQNQTVEEKFNKAIQYFEHENYQSAIPILEKILEGQIKMVAASYYLGVCYMKLDKHLDESIELLKYSRTNNFRTDVHFYLFQAYFKNQQFDEAEISLVNFTNLAKKKERKKMQTDYWHQELVNARTNPQNIEKTEALNIDNPNSEQKIEEYPEANSEIYKESKKQSDYDIMLQRALLTQLVCDSLKSELTTKKIELKSKTEEGEKQKIHSNISEINSQLKHLQLEADGLFKEAETIRSGRNLMAKESIIVEKPAKENEYIYLEKELGDIKLYAFSPKDASLTEQNEVIEVPKENSMEFNILSESPYSDDNPIPVNQGLPDGLAYRIQLGVYSQALPQNAFGGLSPIAANILKEKKLIKYYVGLFYSSIEAKKALQQVKEYGYPDAFLVPYYDQHKISIQSAREKEFGEKR